MTSPRFDVTGLWDSQPARHDGDRGGASHRPRRAVPVDPPPRRPARTGREQPVDSAPSPAPTRRPPAGRPRAGSAAAQRDSGARRTTVHLPSGLAEWVRDLPGRSIDEVLLDAYACHHETVDQDLAAQVNPPQGVPLRLRRRKTEAALVAVSLYLTDAERRLLKHPARQVGMSMSAYATALLERARAHT